MSKVEGTQAALPDAETLAKGIAFDMRHRHDRSVNADVYWFYLNDDQRDAWVMAAKKLLRRLKI